MEFRHIKRTIQNATTADLIKPGVPSKKKFFKSNELEFNIVKNSQFRNISA
jgi:hypothetical protein